MRVPAAYLLTLNQKGEEALREYVTRYKNVRLLVEGHDDQVVLVAMLGGI